MARQGKPPILINLFMGDRSSKFAEERKWAYVLDESSHIDTAHGPKLPITLWRMKRPISFSTYLL
jgi:hypothetical protein